MTMNLLSILLSIAMMLSGSAGLEADVPMANSLTIRDIYFEYNDTSFELTPSLTAGVMTDNGTAVFDLSMQCGEESLFPMQLVVNEESATLVVEKAGKAFSIDAETLNALAAEALDMDELAGDEEFNQALEILGKSYGTAFNIDSYKADAEAIDAEVREMLTPVETEAGTVTYNDVEYQVTSSSYVLDNDQMFELVEIVYASNEQLSELYNDLLDTLNETLALEAEEGEEIPEITSIKDLYAMLGMTMTMELTENVTVDGAFSQAVGAVTLSYEELEEPIVFNIEAVELDGAVDVQCSTIYTVGDMELSMAVIANEDGEENYFEMICEVMPVDAGDLTDEDYEEAVSIYMTGSVSPSEEGGQVYGFNMEASTYDSGFAFLVSGEEDEEGDNTVAIDFEYVDDYDEVAFGFAMDISKAVFANAAEGLEPIAVDPENAEVAEAEFSSVVGSLMIDLQTLVEDESVTEMIAAFTAINTMTQEEVTEVEIADADGEYELHMEEETAGNAGLTFNEPVLTYVPEGMTVEEPEIEEAFNSVTITVADDDYDNVYYIYVYGDAYTEDRQNCILSEDGVLTTMTEKIVTVETEEDALYAEMQDGLITVAVSYYGTEMGLDELGKILAGMTY